MGRPRTKSDREVLEGTVRAISRHGLARLSLADVGAEVGLAPATLVQRYGSKRELLLAVASWAAEAAAAPFLRAATAGGPALAALADLLADSIGRFGSPVEVANHLSFLELDLRDDAFRTHAAAHARGVRAGIRALLARAAADGELVPRRGPGAARAPRADRGQRPARDLGAGAGGRPGGARAQRGRGRPRAVPTVATGA